MLQLNKRFIILLLAVLGLAFSAREAKAGDKSPIVLNHETSGFALPPIFRLAGTSVASPLYNCDHVTFELVNQSTTSTIYYKIYSSTDGTNFIDVTDFLSYQPIAPSTTIPKRNSNTGSFTLKVKFFTGSSDGSPQIGADQIISVNINPSPTVQFINETGSNCEGNGLIIGLDNSETGVNYQLFKDNGTGNVIIGSFISGNTGSNITFPSQTNKGVYTIQATNTTSSCTSWMYDNSIILEKILPTVSISSATPTICSGTNFIFTSSITTGGSTPTYQWQKSVDGITYSSIIGATSATYSSTTLANNDIIRLRMTSNSSYACLINNPTNSNTITMTVTTTVVADVIIAATTATTICNGSNVSFIATPTNGGGAPSYQWKVNGVNAGTANPFTTTALTAATNTVTVQMISNDPSTCLVPANPNPVTSNILTVTAQALVLEGSIGTSQTICYNSSPVAFTGVGGGGSGTLTYRWESQVGAGTWSAISGATGATYQEPNNLTTTTKYRRFTISTLSGVACESVATNVITITVQSVIGIGTISGDQTICNGTSPIVFTSTFGTGEGTLTYQWESKVGTGTWSAISGATSATYDDPNNLTTTTYYRRYTNSTISGTTCISPITNILTVTVQAVVAPGSISSDQTICYASSPVAFISVDGGTGDGLISYTWESKVGAGTWSAISGANLATYYDPNNLTTIKYYRRYTSLTLNLRTCTSPASNSVTVTVQSVITPGAISTNQTICYGTSPVLFTSTVGTGIGTITYRWESNANAGTWAPIDRVISATYDDSNNLTTNTQYRRFTISTLPGGVCESASTNILTVTVQSVPIAGSIGADQTICYGGDPAAFTSVTNGSGDAIPTYRWEKNTNFTTPSWGIVSGANASIYDVPSGLIATTQYRRIAIVTVNGTACESAAAPVVLTVQSVPTAGTIGSDQAICNGGDPVEFSTIIAANGSGTLTYKWELNTNLTTPNWSNLGINTSTYDVPSGLSTTTQYRRTTISSLNLITCLSSASSAVIVSVNTNLPVSVSVVSSAVGNKTCDGANVVFTAMPINQGTTPIYQWQKNGLDIGSNSSTLSIANLLNGDAISVKLISSIVCQVGSPATSAQITTTVNPILPVAVKITSDDVDNRICIGTNVVFTATPTNGGISPVYQWKKNGVIIGTNSATYANTNLANNDEISLMLTSSEACTSNSPAASNVITNTVDQTTIAGAINFSSGIATPICNQGAKPTLTLSGNVGTTIIWQSALSLSSPYSDLATSSANLNNEISNDALGTSAVTTYYRASVKSGVCAITYTAPKSIEVLPTPVITNFQIADRCGPGTMTIGATTNIGTINWFALSSSNTILGSGNNYVTPSLATTTSYFADATLNGCASLTRTEVIATVKTIPTITNFTNSANCGPGILNLQAIASAGSINWYQNISGGVSINNGGSFNTPSLSNTTTYFVDATLNGCTTTTRLPIVATINTIPVIATTNPAAICFPGTIDITNTTNVVSAVSPLNYTFWRNATASIALASPNAIAFSGTYYVKGTDINGCYDTKSIVGTVNLLPVNPVVQNIAYCLNDPTLNITATALTNHTLQWYGQDVTGGSPQANSTVPSSANSGVVTYYVSQTNNLTGCESGRAALNVTTNPFPVVTIKASENPICIGSDLILNGIGAVSYLWDKGNPDGIGFKILAADKYTVTGTDANGCKNTASIDMAVWELPKVLPSVIPYNLCIGNNFSLLNYTSKGLSPYLFIINADNSNVSYTSAGEVIGLAGGNSQLSYKVKDANGCFSNTAAPFNIKTFVPVTSQSFNYEAFYNDNFIIPTKVDVGYSIYDWSPQTNFNFYDKPNPIFNGQDDKYYTLTRTDPVSQCVVSDYYNIHVIFTTILLLPNAFTPNNDGINDQLVIIKNQGIQNINYFRIYNRSGQMVFQTSNISEGWDGRVSGNVQESDAYYWTVEYVTKKAETFKTSGSVLLLK